MEFYVAFLEQTHQAHYFCYAENAIKYLEENNTIPNCTVEPNSDKLLNGEV